MLPLLEVARQDSDTSRQLWKFYYDERHHRLVLDVYAIQSRATKRHHWRNDNVWSRLDRRDCTISRPEVIPPNVIEEAKRKFCDSLACDERASD